MERKKIVLEVPEGYAFDVSQKASGELSITLISITEMAKYGDYTNPPIPEGWEHVEGEWNDGFVIKDSKGNEFVWVPVGFLSSNGTLDGINFSKKFGRRNYRNNEFSDDEFNEKMDDELLKQWESVKKYGGFYISRYNISKSKTWKAQSVKGAMPWTSINWHDAMEAAKAFGDGAFVASHLPFGAEYDSTLEWFIKSNARTEEEIARDSSKWGNFFNTPYSPGTVVETGKRKGWSTNRICDFAGNVDEWTQEKYESSYRVIRGGNCCNFGTNSPVALRFFIDFDFNYDDTGFRAVLYIA